MAKKKVAKAKILEAIKSSRGMKTGICETLNISRPTLDRYLADNEDLQEALEFAMVRDFDRAEYKLSEAIEKGEAWAIQLKLKDHKRGKERGYGNSVDITSKDESINPYMSMPKDDLLALMRKKLAEDE